jgi:phospholipase/carboxylesterase
MRNRLLSSSELTGRLDKLQTSSPSSPTTERSYLDNQVSLFGPERYEPRYDYPLVVWLHSCGSAETELESIMPELSLQNYVGCAPRGTMACEPCGKLFRWGASPTSAAIAEDIVFDAIELASAEFSVDHNKIFLAGFGGGGTMAWRVALRYPDRFAGVASICGDFPYQNQPLSNFEHAKSLSTLWMYGADSASCGIPQVCDTLPILHAASLSVDIRQYPCGNELLSNMLCDLNGWLMERVTSQPANLETTVEESFSRN